ncbi:transglycosylase family protein, partial [[Kitasatospora] papulosa]
MGSATGRHRRPRQAPAIVVAAGVTGSAIAIPLLGAGGAQAADATTWDRVAECESGGMWSADLGNGYYGGLQFSQDTWSAYGGTEYASRADLASRSQQIAVAEKVLDDKGPQAWPSCAVISGLALDGTLPGIDPGGEPSAEPSGTATETPSSDASDQGGSKDDADATSDAEPKGKTKDKGKAAGDTADTGDAAGSADASPSATPSPGTSGASGAAKGDAAKGDASTGGKHRGTPAPESGAGSALDEGRESGRHASRGDSEARQGAAEAYT